MATYILTCPLKIKYLILCLSLFFLVQNVENNLSRKSSYVKADDSLNLLPTVVIATLIRNKAHSLPWFLGLIEKLDYPKSRIALWIESDHNIDNSSAILKEWLSAVTHLYHQVEYKVDDTREGYPDEESPCDWTGQRFAHVIKLREKALNYARSIWADYIFMVDADVTLENEKTLQILMGQKKFIIGPMLNSSVEGFYSNFWAGMTEKGYYVRTDQYIPIVERQIKGVFAVPMVHTAVLIDLHHYRSPNVSFSQPPEGYTGPTDDIIIFAHSVKALGETMHVINTEYIGKLMIPLDKRYTLEEESDQFEYVKLEAMVEEVPPLYSSPHVSIPERPKDKLGFDEIYMINLKRRPARRSRMMKAFDYLGIDAKIVDAVDGKELNDTFLEKSGIKMLPGFADPYHGRAMTMGEIGCFLSHYKIWEEVVEKNYKKILIFEDDVRFEPYFRKKLFNLMYELEHTFDVWDLVYLGRKRLRRDLESMVDRSDRLAWPHYSYWTVSYALSNHGAKKLLEQKPLSKMIPVDEYLPIMFDRHPEDEWRFQFFPRDLIGLSAEPFLLYPTHYTGEPNYISDTEDSVIIDKGAAGQSHKAVDGGGVSKMDRPEANLNKMDGGLHLERPSFKDEL
ncbi:unnamed protein product [Lymnaea stagnalis]|uniref:Glycosyl transferase family 25 domain-containing protein n=1 Tax=Lymnaea stagnalis TaxID=6523 RepID=A0AAV2HAQ9_LYMST